MTGLSAPPLTLDPTALTIVTIGVLGAIAMVLSYLFRQLGDVVDAYYDFRAKCAAARERWQRRTPKERAGDTG